jgi:hypothetical protein
MISSYEAILALNPNHDVVWNNKGSALGLAIMVAIASAQTLQEENSGINSLDAVNNGFHLAFIIAAIVAGIATIVAGVAIKKPKSSDGKEKEDDVVTPMG